MAQAKTDNSTPVPAEATRRRFLSQAAGAAAGGAALALATVSAKAGAAVPMAVLAPSGVDPIFALIEAYRTAAKTHAEACSEFSRREEILIEQGWGLGPFISVLDVSGPRAPYPVLVYKHEYVDVHVPPDRFREVNAAAHASLDAKFEQHKGILGDNEKVMYAAMDAETEAVDELVSTVPTSIAGVLALLELGPELRRASGLDDDQAAAILVSVADALRDLHPNARLANKVTA
jgi:hypothetical protein